MNNEPKTDPGRDGEISQRLSHLEKEIYSLNENIRVLDSHIEPIKNTTNRPDEQVNQQPESVTPLGVALQDHITRLEAANEQLRSMTDAIEL